MLVDVGGWEGGRLEINLPLTGSGGGGGGWCGLQARWGRVLCSRGS